MDQVFDEDGSEVRFIGSEELFIEPYWLRPLCPHCKESIKSIHVTPLYRQETGRRVFDQQVYWCGNCRTALNIGARIT